MKLSQHFTLLEFTRSAKALELGIKNTPTDEHISNMRALCENVMEPIRLHYKRPVIITSGFRSVELNMAINKQTTTPLNLSRHCYGQACDFKISGVSNFDIAYWCKHNLPTYHQIILEFYTPGVPNSGWVHISYVPNNQKKECLTAQIINKKTVYLRGLVA